MKKLILITAMFMATSIWAEIKVLDQNLTEGISVLCISGFVVVQSEDGGLIQLMDRAGRMSGHFGTPTAMECGDY